MDREDIIKMAKEVWIAGDVYIGPNHESLEQFATLVAAHEREACAKVCDAKVDAEYATGKVDHNEMAWTQYCAAAIRERDAT
jgi:hypothetical protein